MEEFKDTRGLIVDLRQYPSDPIVYTLANYIMPQPAAFSNFSFANPAVPGQFQMMEPTPFVCGTENPDLYKGEVVILISEKTLSHAEFTAMSLGQSPNATVIGGPSNGADGNVVALVLPGGISTSFSGLGVYTPDGGQTQRVGVQPDIFCYPTIAGIAQGRDELLEKAIQYIGSEASK
jgi:C-terminal processing protease CtpA/Prc